MKNLFLIALCFTVSLVSNCTSLSDSVNSASNSVSRSSDSASKSSDSVVSVSGSIKSSFGSSSGSSSGGDEKKSELYIKDISDLTQIHFVAKSNQRSFIEDISEIALKHNITNWENSTATFIGIGKGLKKANLSTANLESIKKDISSKNPQASKLIQEGFDSI